MSEAPLVLTTRDARGVVTLTLNDPKRFNALGHEMLAALQKEHTGELVDPNSQREQQPAYAQNATRSARPDVFVAIGICTHLGCSPSAVPAGSNNPGLPADWPGGYFCPCHGSKFDAAGRVFRNQPAPTNLEIPPHRYASDTLLVIGEGPSA